MTEYNLPRKTVDESESVDERLTDNVTNNILPARYLLKDDNGEIIESPKEMFRRVANGVAEAELEFDMDYESYEKWGKEFEKQMEELRLMPNSPTLFNYGTENQQGSACFVINPDDTLESIKETEKEAALVFKSGGGMGYSFSNLRPQGSLIASTGGGSSGPVSFMKMYNENCQQVAQGGKRRGAQMGIMDVRHPDIGRFIVAKRREGNLDNFNISIGVRDEFEQAVRGNEMYTLYDPQTDFEEPFELIEVTEQFYSPEYEDSPEAVVEENLWRDYADSIEAWDWEQEETVSLRAKWEDDERLSFETGEEMRLPARFIWDIILDGAWRNGEPGIVHLDEMNREHSYDIEEHPNKEIIATNPCSEQPLEEYESCTLAHVNLSLLVEQDAPTFSQFDGSAEDYFYDVIDFSNFNRTIEAGVRMLDNIVEANEFPIEELREMANTQRKIGLGLMGFAQMLYQMDIEYGSDESYEMARCAMRHIQQTGAQYSHHLAKERGSFENWDDSKYANPQEHAEWFERFTGLPADDYPDGFAMRNHNVTTIAPTGTTSMIGDTSGGCEPVYNVMYYKNVGNDIQGADKLVEIDDFFRRTLEANDIDVSAVREEALSYMEPDDKSFEGVHQLDTVPDDIAELFVTVNDLSPRQHGIMQRVFQKYNQSGISKTVNLQHDATRADVHDAYLLSIADPSDEPGHRAKGVSLYRDESRNEQVLSTNATTKNAKGEEILTKAEELNGELEDAAEMLDRQHYDDVADLLREVNADA